MMLLLDPTPLTRGLVRKKVEVVNYPDGRFAVQFHGAALGFKLFDKIQTVQPAAIVDNKRLSAVLEQIKVQQAAYPARQQRGTWRVGDRRTTSRRRVCRQRGGRHAMALPQRRPIAPKPATIAPWRGWVFEGSEDLLRCSKRRDAGLATAEWREPTRSDRLPVHRSEFSNRLFLGGLLPSRARFRFTGHRHSSSIPTSAAIQMRCSTPLRRCSPSRAPRARRERECHLYFARRVTFLSCADIFG